MSEPLGIFSRLAVIFRGKVGRRKDSLRTRREQTQSKVAVVGIVTQYEVPQLKTQSLSFIQSYSGSIHLISSVGLYWISLFNSLSFFMRRTW